MLRMSPIDAATVLCSAVIALAIQGRWVMYQEKYFENFARANDRRIKYELDDFVVASCAGTDLWVAGSRCVPVALSNFNIVNTLDVDKDGLGAPTAAAAQSNCL